jgi:hypothetical protein
MMGNPFLDPLALLSPILFVLLRPGRPKVLAAGLLGILLEVALAIERNREHCAESPGLGMGIAGWLGLGYLALQRPSERRFLLQLLRYSVVLPLSMPLGVWQLSAIPQITQLQVYDLHLYGVENCYGYHFSFLVNDWTTSSPWLWNTAVLVYVLPPLLMVVAQVLKLLYPERFYADPTLSFFVLSSLGCASYNLCPAVGPDHFFPTFFPKLAPDAIFPVVVQHVDMLAPRNQMPSLHVAWALMIWWQLRCVGRWPGRSGMVFVALTMWAAFLGTHYLVDYVFSFPIAAFTFVTLAALERRRMPSLGVATGNLLCLVTFFMGIALLTQWPILWWGQSTLVTVASLLMVLLGLYTTYGLHRQFRYRD